MTEAPRTIIRVPLASGSWHGYASEGIWGEPVGTGLFRVLNTPFYVKGLSLGDVISARLEPDGFEFVGVAESGGHSTYRIIPAGSSESVTDALSGLKELGCSWEEGPDGLLALDVPPESNIRDVYAVLDAEAQTELWDFEEGHVGHDLSNDST